MQDLNLIIPGGEYFRADWAERGRQDDDHPHGLWFACAHHRARAREWRRRVAQEPERAQLSIGYLSDFFAVYEDLKVWEYLDYFAHAYRVPESEIPARLTEVIGQVSLEVKARTR